MSVAKRPRYDKNEIEESHSSSEEEGEESPEDLSLTLNRITFGGELPTYLLVLSRFNQRYQLYRAMCREKFGRDTTRSDIPFISDYLEAISKEDLLLIFTKTSKLMTRNYDDSYLCLKVMLYVRYLLMEYERIQENSPPLRVISIREIDRKFTDIYVYNALLSVKRWSNTARELVDAFAVALGNILNPSTTRPVGFQCLFCKYRGNFAASTVEKDLPICADYFAAYGERRLARERTETFERDLNIQTNMILARNPRNRMLFLENDMKGVMAIEGDLPLSRQIEYNEKRLKYISNKNELLDAHKCLVKEQDHLHERTSGLYLEETCMFTFAQMLYFYEINNRTLLDITRRGKRIRVSEKQTLFKLKIQMSKMMFSEDDKRNHIKKIHERLINPVELQKSFSAEVLQHMLKEAGGEDIQLLSQYEKLYKNMKTNEIIEEMFDMTIRQLESDDDAEELTELFFWGEQKRRGKDEWFSKDPEIYRVEREIFIAFRFWLLLCKFLVNHSLGENSVPLLIRGDDESKYDSKKNKMIYCHGHGIFALFFMKNNGREDVTYCKHSELPCMAISWLNSLDNPTCNPRLRELIKTILH